MFADTLKSIKCNSCSGCRKMQYCQHCILFICLYMYICWSVCCLTISFFMSLPLQVQHHDQTLLFYWTVDELLIFSTATSVFHTFPQSEEVTDQCWMVEKRFKLLLQWNCVGVLYTGEGSIGKVQEVSAEEGEKKENIGSWEADSYITNRCGHPLTEWNKKTKRRSRVLLCCHYWLK